MWLTIRFLFGCQIYSTMRVYRSVSPLYVVARSFGRISLEAMDLSKQEAVPIIMSGSAAMMIASNNFPFFLKLWKMILRMRINFLWSLICILDFGVNDMTGSTLLLKE